jgi:hypothetical protein
MTRDEWLELATRCEKATGPDRELDGDIAHAAKQFVDYLPRVPERPWLWAEFVEPDDWECWEAPEYTASLDAITALIERELPDAMGNVQFGKSVFPASGDYVAQLIIGEPDYTAEGWTPALALCAAFAKAMAEKEPAP